jgi:hypothetical protein
VEDYGYLAGQAGIDAAERFPSSAEESFRDLASHPGMEAALPLHAPKLAGLRQWRTRALACISHRLSAAARDKAVSTSLRLVTVLDVLSKYASAR